MDTTATMRIGLGRQAWNFAEHFLEMCVSMCAVGTPLVLLVFVLGPSLIGYADPRVQFPELSLLAIAVFYTAPMVAWMRYRGMEWRPTLEMGGATIAVAVVLIGFAWLGILSATGLMEYASPKFCGPACAVMFLAMLPRLDLYTGRTGHHMGHGAHAAHAM
jgi:Zn-dependent protease